MDVTVEQLSEEELDRIMDDPSILEGDKLEELSPALLVEDTSSRFSGASWFDLIRKQHVTVAGVGGIGSHLAFMLSRVKPEIITIYDDDVVDLSNMSGQLYGLNNVGEQKVYAIIKNIQNLSDYHSVVANNERVSGTSFVDKVALCGFDNMLARRVFFYNWLNLVDHTKNKNECLFIDGRLAAEEFQVFCMTGNDAYLQKRYIQEFLFYDSEADATICSYKQTSFCASMIATVMTNLFVNFVANLTEPLMPRALPFLTTYNAEMMDFKVVME